MKSNKLLLGVLAGVAAGALLGVLMSSDKGSKIRKQIGKLGDSAVDEMKNKLNELAESVSGKMENEQKSVAKITENVKTIIGDAKKDVRNVTA